MGYFTVIVWVVEGSGESKVARVIFRCVSEWFN